MAKPVVVDEKSFDKVVEESRTSVADRLLGTVVPALQGYCAYIGRVSR